MDMQDGAGAHIVVTVHGIRTYGKWQERLESLIKKEDPGSVVYRYQFGYFSVIAFMIPIVRNLVVRQFERWLKVRLQKAPARRIDFVAHSFGTYLVGKTILKLAHRDNFKCHTVILSGSVLKASFPWEKLLGKYVTRLVNDCGVRDTVLLLNQLFILFGGMAGRVGFIGGERTGEFSNRYFDFGHSDYFQVTESFSDEDAFMREAWLPLLASEGGIETFPDRRPELTAVRGLGTFVLNNLEPIKLTLWISPFVILTLIYSALRTDAMTQMFTAQSRFLASESNRELAQFPQRALLLAAEAVAIAVRNETTIEPSAEEQLRKALAATSGIGFQLTSTGIVNSVASCGNTDQAVAGTSDGQIVMIDAASLLQGKVLASKNINDAGVIGVLTNENCTQVATVGADGSIAIWAFASGTFSKTYEHADQATSVHLFSRTSTGHLVFGSREGSVTAVLDVFGALQIFQFDPGIEVSSIALSEDGRWLAAGGADTASDVYYWDLATLPAGSDRRERDCHGVTLIGGAGVVGVPVLKFDPEGKWLFSGGNDGQVCQFAIDASGLGAPIKRTGYKESISDIAIGSFDRLLVASKPIVRLDSGAAVAISDLRPGSPQISYDVTQAEKITASSSYPFAWAESSGEITLTNEAFIDGRKLQGHEGAVTALEFSGDYKWLWSGSEDGSVRVWSTSALPPHAEPRVIETGVSSNFDFTFQDSTLRNLQFSRDGRWLLGEKEENTHIWHRDELGNWSMSEIIDGSPARIDGASKKLYVGITLENGDAAVGSWDLDEADISTIPDLLLHGHTAVQTSIGSFGITNIAVTPDSEWITIGDGAGYVSVRQTTQTSNASPPLILNSAAEVDNEEVVAGFLDDRAFGLLRATSAVSNEDGTMLFTGSQSGRARLWKLDSGPGQSDALELDVFEDPVTNAAFIQSTDTLMGISGTRLLSWNVDESIPIAVQRHVHATRIVSSSLSELAVGTGSEDGEIQVTMTRQLDQPAFHLRSHDSPISDLAFSADGTLLASVDDTGRIVLWDVPKRRATVLDDGTLGIRSVAFSPDADVIVTGSATGALHMWRLNSRALICTALRRAGRSMLPIEEERYSNNRPNEQSLQARIASFLTSSTVSSEDKLCN